VGSLWRRRIPASYDLFYSDEKAKPERGHPEVLLWKQGCGYGDCSAGEVVIKRYGRLPAGSVIFAVGKTHSELIWRFQSNIGELHVESIEGKPS